MSIFDGDGDMFNLALSTAGGHVFWDNLITKGEYTLQQNKISGHCRILNKKNVRVAWGNEGAMCAKLQELTNPHSLTLHCGDVIGVHRKFGLYDHYGIYEKADVIYEYASDTQNPVDATIRITTLDEFRKDAQALFRVEFPEKHGTPGKIQIEQYCKFSLPRMATFDLLKDFSDYLLSNNEYHLYSPTETVERAKSKLGQKEYNLMINNCEHFAIWCKTGLAESHQSRAVLGGLENIFRVVDRTGKALQKWIEHIFDV